MKELTFKVSGREMTFSEEELITILENHFAGSKTVPKPTEGIWFEVNPRAINQELFANARESPEQENTRQYILKALAMVNDNPEKYGISFETIMPEKNWDKKTGQKLEELASNFGYHMANWFEQSLEWAQRISNGETWEIVCNEADTANWHRAVLWEDNYIHLIGGASKIYNSRPASDVGKIKFREIHKFYHAIPLVARYK